MVDFDKLNRETREYNSRVHSDYTSTDTYKYGSSDYWRNYWNNRTYKANNGQYTKHYY